MRITAKAKEKTRERIIESARKLFTDKGFDETTTRDIASAAGIATGTLFNYYPSKEALAMSLVAASLDAGRLDFEARRRGEESLEEDLFAHIMTGLRQLAPHRGYVGAVMETAMSPFAKTGLCDDADRTREEHLERVTDVIASHGLGGAPPFVVMHLYWTLYLGVLAFWSRDTSDKQEETLAVLDHSLRLFVASLRTGHTEAEVNHVT